MRGDLSFLSFVIASNAGVCISMQDFTPLAKRSHGIEGLEQCLTHSQASK